MHVDAFEDSRMPLRAVARGNWPCHLHHSSMSQPCYAALCSSLFGHLIPDMSMPHSAIHVVLRVSPLVARGVGAVVRVPSLQNSISPAPTLAAQRQ